MKTTTKQMLGHFKKAGVAPKRIVKEFPVTPDAHVPVGKFRVFASPECPIDELLQGRLYLRFISFQDNM